MTGPTYCSDCEHVEAASRKQAERLWLCRRHVRLVNDSFVTHTSWTRSEPFLRCRDTNGGACPLFEPLRYPSGDTHVD